MKNVFPSGVFGVEAHVRFLTFSGVRKKCFARSASRVWPVRVFPAALFLIFNFIFLISGAQAAILPGQQIGLDVGPAVTKTGAPWTDVSVFGSAVPVLDLATGATIPGVSVTLTADGSKGVNNLSNTTLNSGSLASGAAPANVLCDGAVGTGGAGVETGVYLKFSGLNSALVYRLEIWSIGTQVTTDFAVINGVKTAWPAGMENRALRKAAPGPAVFENVSADGSGVLQFAVRHVNNPVLSGVRLTASVPAGVVYLPYIQNTDTLSEGALGGQIPAKQVPENCASIVAVGSGEEAGKALAIAPANPPGEVTFGLVAPADFGKILWFETSAKIVATETRSQFLDVDGMLVALVKDASGGAHLEAYDGKQGLATGGGAWVKLKTKNEELRTETGGNGVLSSEFFVLSLRADYSKKKYDVFVNGELAGINLGFDDARIQKPDTLALYGQTAGTNYFRKIYLSNVAPGTIAFSSAGDGIADAWKAQYGIQVSDTTARDADADGNGLTLLQEYFLGLAPGAPAKTFLGKYEIAGGFYNEVWKNIPGIYLSRLIAETNDFQKTPDVISLTKGAEAPANFGENFGRRMRGYVTLPETGTYNFYIAADDTAELRISQDGTKWHAVKAAVVSSYTGSWTTRAEQKSPAYALPAGTKLYVEIRHKDGGGGNLARLGWTYSRKDAAGNSVPVQTTPALVPADAISSFVFDANDQDDDDLPDSWERNYNLDTTDKGLVNAAAGKHGYNNKAGLDNYLCWQLGLDPHNPDIAGIVGKVSVAGVFQRGVWTDITGFTVAELTGNAKFAGTPDLKTFIAPEGVVNDAKFYGERWRGWLVPATSGNYSLRISSDDDSQLWLSTDESVANKRRIAREAGYVGRYAAEQAKQTSFPVNLVAGKKYYIEVLHKQFGGGTHCELSWATPEAPGAFVPLPPENVVSWVEDAALDQLGCAETWLRKYNLEANTLLPDGKFAPNSYLANRQAERAGTDPRATIGDLIAANVSGFWIRDTWTTGINLDVGIDANASLFGTLPDYREVVKGGDDFATQVSDVRIDRTRGLIAVPESGLYRFAISCDDSGEFLLSTDATPENAKIIAQNKINSAWNDFTSQAAQMSAPVYLETGKKYYAELRHVENAGNDFVQLAWATPAKPNELAFVPASAMSLYIPPADDPNGWGYPQSWLQSTGLAALPIAQQLPGADPTGGGLTNLEKYRLGLNPLSLDTDGDGISDYEEVMLSHTDPRVKDFDGSIQNVITIAGADFLSALGGTSSASPTGGMQGTVGNWQKSGTSVYAGDIRGTLAYTVTLPENTPATPLRLLITGGQYLAGSADKVLSLDVYADTGYIGRVTLNTEKSFLISDFSFPVSQAALWLPPLPAGAHTLQLVWLNGTAGTSLRIDSLALQALGGTWLAARQNNLTVLDETPATSYVSPYCLEGGAQDAGKLTVTSNYIPDTNAADAYSVFVREKFYGAAGADEEHSTFNIQHSTLKAKPALRGKYYSNIPLSPAGVASDAPTTITVLDATTGATRTKQITWAAYDLAAHAGETVYLRTGDALLLKSGYTGETAVTVTAPDGTHENFLFHISDFLFPRVFAAPGTYTLTAGTGAPITVRAIPCDLGTGPTVILNQMRRWVPPQLPAEAVIESDPGLYVSDHLALVSGKRALDLSTSVSVATSLIARLGDAGPILGAASVSTLVSYGNPSEKWDIVRVFDDGTQLWRGQINLGGKLPDDFRIVITPYKAGVTFLNGGLRLEITAADFGADGTYTYYILRAEDTDGAPCHYVTFYEGDEKLMQNNL